MATTELEKIRVPARGDEFISKDLLAEFISGKRILRVGCCQIDLRIFKNENIEKILQFADRAADLGANLILLPELASTGCIFDRPSELYDVSEEVPGGDTTKAYEKFAKKRGVYLAAGIAEREGDKLFNSSVLVGPRGYIGKYRKLHLSGDEKMLFEPGNLGLPIFNTDWGRLAMCICYDMFFPETIRIYALQGAELILNMANWSTDRRLAEALGYTHARLNSVFVATAARVGSEKGGIFLGKSMIVSPKGDFLAGPVNDSEERIIYADCNLAESKLRKWTSMFDNIERDRRTDIYSSFLGYDGISPSNRSIRVDEKVLQKAQELGLNVSEISERALIEEINRMKNHSPKMIFSRMRQLLSSGL